MSSAPDDQVTRLLQAWNEGSEEAPGQLLPLVYERLRAMARQAMSQERASHTLQPTALVHEAFLRMSGGAAVRWQDRAHFYCLAARAMRRILVDHARTRGREKRGGEQERVSLTKAERMLAPALEGESVETDVVALDQALVQLSESHPRPSQVVELRFFAGMEARDIAEVLEVSEKTVLRDWQFAKLWLHRELVPGAIEE
jgi:RNA polymerase sigma factor (TIGR02999 family)